MPLPPITLVLASASQARRATLVAAGVDPVVMVSDVDESEIVDRYGVTDPQDVALVLAKAKAEAVAARAALDDLAGSALVLGCDSVLDLDGEVHGKPTDPDQALARWRRMRGRRGVLHTGHWIVDTRDQDGGGTGGTVGSVASTIVHFADLTDEEIIAYVASGEPLLVAGAFTVDGLGGPYITGIEGDHHNVVGVSLPLLRTLLRDLGVQWHHLWRTGRPAPLPRSAGRDPDVLSHPPGSGNTGGVGRTATGSATGSRERPERT